MRRGVEHAHFAKNAPGIGPQIVSLKIPDASSRPPFWRRTRNEIARILFSRVPLTYLNVQGEWNDLYDLSLAPTLQSDNVVTTRDELSVISFAADPLQRSFSDNKQQFETWRIVDGSYCHLCAYFPRVSIPAIFQFLPARTPDTHLSRRISDNNIIGPGFIISIPCALCRSTFNWNGPG